jgi:hypothetical protein
VSDAVSDDLNREALRVADRLVSNRPITHDAWKFDGLGDPAPVFLPIKFDRQIHALIIPTKRSVWLLPHWITRPQACSAYEFKLTCRRRRAE